MGVDSHLRAAHPYRTGERDGQRGPGASVITWGSSGFRSEFLPKNAEPDDAGAAAKRVSHMAPIVTAVPGQVQDAPVPGHSPRLSYLPGWLRRRWTWRASGRLAFVSVSLMKTREPSTAMEVESPTLLAASTLMMNHVDPPSIDLANHRRSFVSCPS